MTQSRVYHCIKKYIYIMGTRIREEMMPSRLCTNQKSQGEISTQVSHTTQIDHIFSELFSPATTY